MDRMWRRLNHNTPDFIVTIQNFHLNSNSLEISCPKKQKSRIVPCGPYVCMCKSSVSTTLILHLYFVVIMCQERTMWTGSWTMICYEAPICFGDGTRRRFECRQRPAIVVLISWLPQTSTRRSFPFCSRNCRHITALEWRLNDAAIDRSAFFVLSS